MEQVRRLLERMRFLKSDEKSREAKRQTVAMKTAAKGAIDAAKRESELAMEPAR